MSLPRLCTLTYSVHAGILKPWRGRLPWLLVVLPFYHVYPLPLSGLNWRSLFPPWGSGPPSPKWHPIYRVRAHSLTGIRNRGNYTVFIRCHVGGVSPKKIRGKSEPGPPVPRTLPRGFSCQLAHISHSYFAAACIYVQKIVLIRVLTFNHW